jgi:hypothetical protein
MMRLTRLAMEWAPERRLASLLASELVFSAQGARAMTGLMMIGPLTMTHLIRPHRLHDLTLNFPLSLANLQHLNFKPLRSDDGLANRTV